MKRNWFKRLSVLLAAAMLTSLLPGFALAAEPGYRYGTLQYFSSITQEYVGDTFYYTDQWFLGDPARRNDGLALVSAQLAAAVTDDPQYGLDLLTQLGFEASAHRFDSELPDDCAYVMGTKTIQADGRDRTLIAVAFQGTAYGGKGWRQNVTVNGGRIPSYDHAAFASAAKAFAADYEKLFPRGDVILWITGQSRGGAVANAAAAGFLGRANHPVVFGYTFESPAVTDNPGAHAAKYGGIQNYLCDDDLVTMLPMWGMTRYGQEIQYNSADVADVAAELKNRNEGACPYAREYDAEPEGKGLLDSLVRALAGVVPTRADYTRLNIDRFTADGASTEVRFTYQSGLQALCHLVFDGEGDTVGRLLPLLDQLGELTYSGLEEAYASARDPSNGDALRSDAVQRRWRAAGALYDAVTEAGAAPGFSREDLYALLKLVSPFLVNADAVKDAGWTLPAYNPEAVMESSDLSAAEELFTQSPTLFFSHHSDVILARLRLLAPAPEMENVSLTMPDPKAGDGAAAAPDALVKNATGLNRDWLTVQEAGWQTEDTVLADNKVYYLSVTLAAAGHTVPADLSFTVNGKNPLKLETAYQDGKALVTGVWKVTLGSPARFTVRYDANGHGAAPAAASMDAGTVLRYAAESPDLGTVKDSGGAWRFDGWFDPSGTTWEKVTVQRDLTLRARWLRSVDEISLTYAIPHVGDSGGRLLAIAGPTDAPYRVTETALHNAHFDTVTSIAGTDELRLSFKVILPGEDLLFPVRDDGHGFREYAGSLTVNGETIPVYYFDFAKDDGTREIYLSAEYSFTPLSGGGSVRPDRAGFVDVPADAYYADAVKWAVSRGVTKGTDAAHFSPNAPCTRAEMAAFLWRAAGQRSPSETEALFVDVPGDAYYAKAVQWAAEAGIAQGIDGTHFSPDTSVDRGQCVTFLYRMLGDKTDGACPFADVPSDAYCADAVSWGAASGVTIGKSAGRFAPADVCSRGEIVTFLYRAMEKRQAE